MLTVVICAYNPRPASLQLTLDALRRQKPVGAGEQWELLLIDNASTNSLDQWVDLSWHPRSRIVREDRLGLTYARLRSFHEARGDIIVYVDDDNVLEQHYLSRAAAVMAECGDLGAVGGRVLPRYETDPPPWFAELGIDLACRDLGDRTLRASWREVPPHERDYPSCAPIGAGMVIRKAAYAAYVEAITSDSARQELGRRGSALSSGEDNDMVMTLLSAGWQVAYLPDLRIEHLIPGGRLEPAYLGRYAYSSNRTWVQVLGVHGIRPWAAISPWSAPLRKAQAFLRNKAWRSPANRIRWRMACGLIDGRSQLGSER